MATTEMIVVRVLARKMKRMTTAKRAPSINERPTLFTDASIKSACLNILVSIRTSDGSDFLISLRLASICSVTFRVLIFGCFDTERITDGLAFCEALPIRRACPMVTSATSDSTIGLPFTVFTSELPRASRSVVLAIPLRAYSLP